MRIGLLAHSFSFLKFANLLRDKVFLSARKKTPSYWSDLIFTPTRPSSVFFLKQLNIRAVFILFFVFNIGNRGWGQTVSYTTAGTYKWVCPTGVTNVTVQAWGGGGGGGGGATVANAAGGGGGGGAFAQSSIAVTPGTTYTIIVGSGGTAGANTGTSGGVGGSSSFGTTLVVAVGGNGGGGTTTTTAGTAGAGGLSTSCTGTIKYSGGNGAAGVPATSSGASGSSAGTGSNGNNATGATAGAAPVGGVAGVAGNTTAGGGAGTAGNAGGGGASGGRRGSTATNRAGGLGGAGKVVLTYTCPSYSYATLPFSESFEIWSSSCGTAVNNLNSYSGDLVGTGMNWKNSVAYGNTSWRRNDAATTTSAWTSTTGAYSPTSSLGTYSARFHSYNAALNTTGSLDIYLDFSTAGTKELKFDYINPTGTDNLILQISTDGGVTFTNVGTAYATATAWTAQTISNLSTSVSTTVVIRFLATSDFGNDDIGIDNIKCCVLPTISAQPSSAAQTICTGGALTALSVTATGISSYQWYSNTTASTTGGTLISGATLASYTPPNNVVGTTYYYCICTSGCGTTVTSAVSGAITVNATPATPGAITGATSFCSGSTGISYSVTAVSGATGYTWTVPSGAIVASGSGTNSITVNFGSTSGNISVVATNSCGTSAASTLAVTLSSPTTPSVSIGASPSTTICSGTNLTFTATGSGLNGGTITNYNWYKNGVSVQSGASNTYSFSGYANGNTVYCIITVSGCVSPASATSATSTVTVSSTPTLSVNSPTYCSGGSAVAVTASGASTYSWSPATGLSATTGTTVNANPSSTTVYTVTGTSAAGCTATATSTVSVGTGVPTPTVSISPTSVCSGGTATLTATPANLTPTANNYTFSTGTGLSLLNPSFSSTLVTLSTDDIASSVVTLPFNFVYEGVTYTGFSVNSNGLLKLGSAATTNEWTNLFSSATNVPKLMGIWDDLNSSSNGGVVWGTYGASPNRIVVIDYKLVNSATTAVYNLNFQVWLYEGTNEIKFVYGTGTTPGSFSCGIGGATASNFISVSTSANTASNATANDANATWPGSGRYYSFVPPPTYSYSWSPSTFLSATNTATTTATTVTATTVYTVTVTNGGCSNTASSTLTSSPVSVGGTASSGQAICSGTQPANITLVGNTGSIQWQSSTDNITFNDIAGATASPLTSAQMGALSATTYYRALVTSGACSPANSNVVTVSVTPSAVAGTASASPSTVCSGGTSTVTVTGYTGSIQWEQSTNGTSGWASVTGGSGATTSSYTTASLASTLYYRASVTSGSCGTAYSNTVSVTVGSPTTPTASVSVSPSATVCSGVSVTFTASGGNLNGTSIIDYNFLVNGSSVQSGASNTFTSSSLANNSSVQCQLTLTSGCVSTTSPTSSPITMTVNDLPVISVQPSSSPATYCQNATASALSVSASAGSGTISTYQWYRNNTATTTGGTAVGTNSSSYVPSTANISTRYYYCVITNSNGCSITSSVSGAINVITIPSITTSPVSVSVAGGGNTSFSVVASDNPTSYTWQVSTNGGSSWSTVVDGGVYSGATTATLSITGAAFSMNNYQYRVTATNACGTSPVSAAATLTVTYCTPTYTNACSSLDFINSVYTGGGTTNINNQSSGCSGAANNYSYHTATSLTVPLAGSFTINLQSGASYGQGFGVWIDYNQNGTFEATEFVYSTASSTALNTSTITVPGTASLGATRMRVRCLYNATPANTDACTNLTYGETEDYNVTISPPPPPTITSFSPTSGCAGTNVTLTGTNLSTTSAVSVSGTAVTSFTVNSATQVAVTLPSSFTTGTFSVTTLGGSVTSSGSFTVLPTPAPPTVSAPTTTLNVGGSASITATASGSGTLNWYDAATGGTLMLTGTTWNTGTLCAAATTTTYYVEENNGSCGSVRTSVSVTTRPLISSNPTNGIICTAGGSVILSANITNGTSYTWSPSASLSGSTTAVVTASPTVSTQYTLNTTVTGCASVTGSNTFNVGVIDGVSFTPVSTPTSVCEGGTALLNSNLSTSGFTYTTTTFSMATPSSPTNLCSNGVQNVAVTSGNLDDGGWANIPIGFTYNFFGNSYSTVNIGTNGVLQFGTYNATTLGDFTFASALPTATEPTNIIAAAANDYYASVSGTIRYWTQGISPTRVFVAEWNAVPGYTTNGSMTVQVKLFETTGNVEVHVQNASSTNNKVVGLQNANASVGATAYSSTTAITNTAWRFVPGATYTFQWSTGGSAISGATSSTYTTPVLSVPGAFTYTCAATNPNTQCASTSTVQVTVNANPSAPTSGGDVTACSIAGTQTLTVTPPSGSTVNWYSASTGGTLLVSGNNNYTTSTAGTYYAGSVSAPGCNSPTRTGVTLTVNASPAVPTANATVSYCQGAIASPLSATASGGNTLNWYTVAVGGTPSTTAPTPSTASVGTTSYWVSQVSGTNGCEGARFQITVTINSVPSSPTVSTPVTYCQNASASQLSAGISGGNTANWYTVPTGGTASGTAPTPSTTGSGTTNYYVSQTSINGCESSRSLIAVVVNPTLIASVNNSASSTSACSGGAIVFTATPTNGGTSPTYQWYKNGSAQSGQTASTYTLSTPVSGDQIYVQMVSNAAPCLSVSTVNSNTVTLTSTPSTPSVTISSSTSTTVCPGTSVTFSVSSSANMGSTPTYQWKLNGSNISGATASSYTTSALSNNDQVSLVMTSSLNGVCLTVSTATSNVITYSISPATIITTQPVSASACLGTSQSFSVSATGTGTLTYQWKKGGVNITGNATAQTATLTLSGITAGDAANYSVDVAATCGTVSSNTVTLGINAATAITTQPSALTRCVGTSATFSVLASGTGTLTYQWRFNGTPISGATSSTYTIPSVVTGDGGNYSVVVTGGCGSQTSSNALLTINPLTAISSQPSAVTVCQGNSATFAVTASGTAPLTYQWNLNGSAISGATSSSYTDNNAQIADAGQYSVVITGGCGSVTSNSVTLTVNPSTSITAQPINMQECVGQSAAFTVVASGTSPLTYQWKFNGSNISGATGSTHTIASPTIADDGTYQVVVTGGCGTVNSNAVTLTVYPTLTSGSVSSSQTICYNTAPGAFTSVTGAGGGTGTYTYQWQNSTDGTTWNNISGANAATYTSGTLTTTTYFRRNVTSGNCDAVSSNTLTITVNPATAITAQSTASQTVCINGSFSVMGVTAAGVGLGYQWYSNTTASTTGGTLISGATTANYTPPATTSGTTYYYAIVSGTCGTATSSVSGAIVVDPVNTAGAANLTPTVCVNTAMTNINHITTGATGIGSPMGLPSGITASWASNILTISGTPTQSGTFNYTIPLTGGCGSASATGTIIVTPLPSWYNVQSPSSASICVGGSASVYGQVYLAGITDPAGQASGMTAQVGYSTNNTDPSTWTNWVNATFNTQNGNNDEFVSSIGSSLSAGTYYYAFRYSYNGCTYVYGGLNGPWNGTTNLNGVLTVNPTLNASVAVAASATLICQGTIVTFTATPTNGGSSPSYQWQVNGSNVSGATSSIFSTSSLNDNDNVTVILTSNASPCLAGSPATSNPVIISISPNANVGIASNNGPVCTGSNVVFNLSGTPGSTVIYNINGGTTQTVTTDGSGIAAVTIIGATTNQTLNINSVTSSFGCVNNTTVQSQVIVNPEPAQVIVSPSTGSFCGSVVLSASNGNDGVIYWQGTNSNGTSISTPGISQTVSSTGIYYFRAQSANGCWGQQGSANISITGGVLVAPSIINIVNPH